MACRARHSVADPDGGFDEGSVQPPVHSDGLDWIGDRAAVISGFPHIQATSRMFNSRRRLWLFVLGFIGPWIFALLFPLARWPEIAEAVAITAGIMLGFAGIMLGFAGLGFLGMPMKGNADPRDVTAGALGMLAHAGVFGGLGSLMLA